MKPVKLSDHLTEAVRTTASPRNVEYSPDVTLDFSALVDQGLEHLSEGFVGTFVTGRRSGRTQ